MSSQSIEKEVSSRSGLSERKKKILRSALEKEEREMKLNGSEDYVYGWDDGEELI